MGNSADPDFNENFARSVVRDWRGKYAEAHSRADGAASVKAANGVDAAEIRLQEIVRTNRGKSR